MEKLKSIDYKESINYIFWGVATTLINYFVYLICAKVILMNYILSNNIAWFISILFAFITNKIYVFKSMSNDIKNLFREGIIFALSRVFSLIIEVFILYILVGLMNYGDSIVKLIANLIVITLNYFLSKYIIFKNN